jgi:hypothetical protein
MVFIHVFRHISSTVFKLSAIFGAIFSLKTTSRRIGDEMRRLLSRAVISPFYPIAFENVTHMGFWWMLFLARVWKSSRK